MPENDALGSILGLKSLGKLDKLKYNPKRLTRVVVGGSFLAFYYLKHVRYFT